MECLRILIWNICRKQVKKGCNFKSWLFSKSVQIMHWAKGPWHQACLLTSASPSVRTLSSSCVRPSWTESGTSFRSLCTGLDLRPVRGTWRCGGRGVSRLRRWSRTHGRWRRGDCTWGRKWVDKLLFKLVKKYFIQIVSVHFHTKLNVSK